MIERRGIEPVEAAQPVRDCGRDGVAAHALAEHLLVERQELCLEPDVALVVAEVAVDRAGELVGRPVLMDEPAHLARVAGEVAGKLRADHQVNRPPVAFGQIEHPPRRGVRQDLVFRVPLEGQGDAIGLEPARPQLVHQLADQQLGTASHERHLRLADKNGSDAQRVRDRSMRARISRLWAKTLKRQKSDGFRFQGETKT